jgi:hypothetical protein
MMLPHTFCHIPGIGPKREQHIWSQGLHTWEEFLKNTHWPADEDSLLNSISFEYVREHVQVSLKKFNNSDLMYFNSNLPTSETWRLFGFPGMRTGYLDIETTGLGKDSTITTIALYSQGVIHYYVEGENLELFEQDVNNCDILVTYNGRAFDLPFISRQLGIKFHQAHIDLRFVLAELGYKGGLKGCEKSLGIDRGNLYGLDGYDAVLLWKEYLRTSKKSFLDTLLAYNIADTVNLETLLILAYNMKAEKISQFRMPPLALTKQPESHFFPSDEAVLYIRRFREVKSVQSDTD